MSASQPEGATPAPSAPQTPRTDAFFSCGKVPSYPDGTINWYKLEEHWADFARTLELESAARQRVIEAIELECNQDIDLPIIQDILAIIADGKEGK